MSSRPSRSNSRVAPEPPNLAEPDMPPAEGTSGSTSPVASLPPLASVPPAAQEEAQGSGSNRSAASDGSPNGSAADQTPDAQMAITIPEPGKDVKLDEPAVEEEVHTYADVTWMDIVKQFSLLGWIAFGGPAAHIGLFQKRLVEKLRWMSDEVYMELFALGQCLPGPTSTQVSFALGTVRKGVLGGLLSGALFQYPGAIIMTAVGVGAANTLQEPALWLRSLTAGVSAVGVALVASAAKGLLLKLCNTKLLAIVGTLAAGAAIYWSPPWLFPLIIAVAGLITIISNWKVDMSYKNKGDDGVKSLGLGMKMGGVLICIWLAILITVLVLVRTLDYDHRRDDNPLDWFEVFFRIGSIIYGGGQVVLPMLLSDLVKQDCQQGRTPVCIEDPETSWMSSEQFYAGLGIVQAMPGPLFNFSAYLGAIIAWNQGYVFIVGTIVAWFGLFGPGVMLMFAVLPFWKRFRQWQIYRRALPGMNAASVGLILASVFKMTVDVYNISPFPTSSLVIGLFAFTAVDSLHIFEPFVVAGGILLGLIAWGAKTY